MSLAKGAWFGVLRTVLLVIPVKALLRLSLRADNLLYDTVSYLAVKRENGVHPKHRLTKYHGFFVDNVGTDDAVLDVGCGIGLVARDLARKARRVVGIDMNARNIEQARERLARDNLVFRCGCVPEALTEEQFDVLVLSNVLEHQKRRPGFLRELIRRTRASRVLIRVPMFSRDWRMPLKRELGVAWCGEGHEVEYDRETFLREMDEAGLACDSVSVEWGEFYAVCRPEGE